VLAPNQLEAINYLVRKSSINKKTNTIIQSFEKSARYDKITKALINQGFC
jgi:hypothetical protein